MKSLVFMLIFLVSTANARMLVKIYLHTPKNIKILVENGVDVVYYDRKSLTVEAVVKDSTLLTYLGFKKDSIIRWLLNNREINIIPAEKCPSWRQITQRSLFLGI